jgi:hypothetical protein
MTCRDIKKSNLVCTLLVVAPGDLDRVTRVAYIDKIDALNHAAVLNI